MNSVHPFDAANAHDRKVPTAGDVIDASRPCDSVGQLKREVSGSTVDIMAFAAKVEDNCDVADDLVLPGEVLSDQKALADSLKVMLICMKMMGSYFKKERDEDGGGSGLLTKTPCTKGSRFSRIRGFVCLRNYCIVIQALLWFNALRFFSVFSSDDFFGPMMMFKLTCLFLMILCAVLHTSYFIASYSGDLDQHLRELRVSAESAALYHRRAIFLVACTDAILLAVVVTLTCVLFVTDGAYDFLLAPFVVYIPIGKTFATLVKVFVLLFFCYMVPAWTILQSMNHLLAEIIQREFDVLFNSFRKAIDNRGRFSGDIKIFRRRHQALCQLVKKADSFIMISNLAAFFCHAVNVILTLYSLMFFQITDGFLFTGILSLFIGNAVCLSLATIDGIRVNHAAHRFGEIIPSIDFSTLKSTDVIEVIMFQKRVTGNPIGFSVLGIFVISKSTILTLLAQIITYYLLVVRMAPSVSTSAKNQSLNTNITSTTAVY